MESSDLSGKTPQFPGPRIAVIGTSNWLDVTAELLRRAGLRCDVLQFGGRTQMIQAALRGRFRKYDVVHCVGGRARVPGLLFKLLGKPVVWHWIGTDVMHYGKIHAGGGGLRGAVDRFIAHRCAAAHVADSPQLADELRSYGVESEVVRLLPSAVEAEVQPLPESPAVLNYWRPHSRAFYHAPMVMQLAEAFPDVRFYVAGDDGEGLAGPKNVIFLGALPELDDIYGKISVYLRVVEHDSLSAIVLEALARGRYVIYSEPFPHTQHASDFASCCDALKTLLARKQPNQAGADYVRKHFNLDHEAASLSAVYAPFK